jgi:WD40 repeat protein
MTFAVWQVGHGAPDNRFGTDEPQLERDWREGRQHAARAFAWSPDGTMAATYRSARNPATGREANSWDNEISTWHLATEAHLHAMNEQTVGHEDRVGLAWSPDGVYVAATVGREVKIWHAQYGYRTQTLTGHARNVHAVAYSPDGKWIATASEDHTVRLWRPGTGEPAEVLLGHTRPVFGLSWSADSNLLASAGADGTRVWRIIVDGPDRAAGTTQANLATHGDPRPV